MWSPVRMISPCWISVPNPELIEEERKKIRSEYEQEMLDMREKYKTEQQR